MNTHPYDTLTLANGTSFIFTPCPGTKDTSVADAVSQLNQAGASAIITLMYDNEIERLGATSLANACNELAINWFQLPMPDDACPNEDFEEALNAQWPIIRALLEQKKTIAVHCKGGSGRTGLMIGLLMLQLGYAQQEIIAQVQKMRPKALMHDAQLNYFKNFKLLGETL